MATKATSSEIVETGELHFSYSGEFIRDLARTAYWFENRREWAIRLLKCVMIPQELTQDQIFYLQSRGLTMDQIWGMMEHYSLNEEQIGSVLNGTARLTDESMFVREPDRQFQKALEEQKARFVEIGDHLIPKKIAEAYLHSLEQPGQSKVAYEEVCKAAGFVKLLENVAGVVKLRIDKSPESLGFQSALLKLGQLYLGSRQDQK